MYFKPTISVSAIVSVLATLSKVFASSNGVSPDNTILENLNALALNQAEYNASVNYVSLLLGLNTSCTSGVAAMLNSSEGNYTFFAPNDDAFRAIPGFPDFGPNFCGSCENGSGNGQSSRNRNGNGRSIIKNINGNSSSMKCPMGCNDTSLAVNATSSELMPCLPQMLQYHLLNETLNFNSTSFGFLNASSFNYTVLPTFLNSSCLVNLSGNGSNGSNSNMNNQVLVFNITNGNGDGETIEDNGNFTSPFNVSILHGINNAAYVTLFDIPSSNGVLHVIDALLIPPSNLTSTINDTYSSLNETSIDENEAESGLPSFLNSTDLEMYANMSGITVFLPDTLSGDNQSTFNMSSYVFPELFYNNRSFELIGNLSENVFFQQNLTNLNDENVTILFGRDNAMLFNGSRVIESNILMKNGVLHIFNGTESSLLNGNGSQNNTESGIASGLGRLMRQFIN